MNTKFGRFVRTVVVLIVLAAVALAMIYTGRQKNKPVLEGQVVTSNTFPDDKYYDEEMEQIKAAAQQKRIVENEARLNAITQSNNDKDQAKNNAPAQTAQPPKTSNTGIDGIIKSDKPLEQKIRDYLGTKVSKVGIGYYDIDTGKGFSINGGKYFTAASTVKVPMNIVLFDMVKEGKVNINEALQYISADYEGGTGILQGQNKSKPISLLTLSDYSIIYSDNIATNMIIRRINHTEMKRRFGEKLGHSVPMDKNVLTPNDALTFLKLIYQNKDNNQYYPRLIGIMKTTVFHDRLDKYVPKSIVAHKIGNYGAYVNDIGIVYAPKPYIIAVYTESLADANDIIANINKILYEAHK